MLYRKSGRNEHFYTLRYAVAHTLHSRIKVNKKRQLFII